MLNQNQREGKVSAVDSLFNSRAVNELMNRKTPTQRNQTASKTQKQSALVHIKPKCESLTAPEQLPVFRCRKKARRK
jgi:hypothetical protein